MQHLNHCCRTVCIVLSLKDQRQDPGDCVYGMKIRYMVTVICKKIMEDLDLRSFLSWLYFKHDLSTRKSNEASKISD